MLNEKVVEMMATALERGTRVLVDTKDLSPELVTRLRVAGAFPKFCNFEGRFVRPVDSASNVGIIEFGKVRAEVWMGSVRYA